jgi:hypothetical protein
MMDVKFGITVNEGRTWANLQFSSPEPSLASYEPFEKSSFCQEMSETCSTHGLLEPGTNASPISAANGAFSLENILGENHDAVQQLATKVGPMDDEEDIERPFIEGYCVECEGNFYQ